MENGALIAQNILYSGKARYLQDLSFIILHTCDM